jgi:hypothetical protein
MKLEVARLKGAMEAEIKQKEDALRLLGESTNLNIFKDAQIRKNIIGLQEAKRSSRWLTASNKALTRKNDMHLAELADLKSRLFEQHDKDTYKLIREKEGKLIEGQRRHAQSAKKQRRPYSANTNRLRLSL